MDMDFTSQSYAAYDNISPDDLPKEEISIDVSGIPGVYTERSVFSYDPNKSPFAQRLDINAFLALAIAGKIVRGTGFTDECLVFSYSQFPKEKTGILVFKYQRWVLFTEKAIFICNVFGGDTPTICVYTTSHGFHSPSVDPAIPTVDEELLDQISYVGMIAADDDLFKNAPIVTVSKTATSTLEDFVVGVVKNGSSVEPIVPPSRPSYEVFSTQPSSLSDFVSPYHPEVISAVIGMIHRGFAHVKQYEVPLRFKQRN